MDKPELLDQVIQLDNSPRAAVKLAWHTLTDERIARRHAKAQKAVTDFQRKLRLFERVGYALGAMGVGMCLYANSSILAAAIGLAVMLCFTVWMGLTSIRLVAERILYGVGAGLALRLLAPAAGTAYGELAVKALTTGGQKTAMWRDLALQDRSQLHVFDVLIMEALAKAEWAAAMPEREAQLCMADAGSQVASPKL